MGIKVFISKKFQLKFPHIYNYYIHHYSSFTLRVILQRLYATSSIMNFRPINFPTYCNIRPTTAVGRGFTIFKNPTFRHDRVLAMSMERVF